MRRTIQLIQLSLFIAFLFKMTALGTFFYGGSPGDGAVSLVTEALAEKPPVRKARPVRDILEDPWKTERTLYQALKERQKELDLKESAVREEEKNLLILKEELAKKMEQLTLLEKKLEERILAMTEEDDGRYKDLAKVFETTPPAKAGTMLEELDTKTAAIITLRMKRDKAGAIWGYLSPRKAVEITNEISRTMNGGAP